MEMLWIYYGRARQVLETLQGIFWVVSGIGETGDILWILEKCWGLWGHGVEI